MNRASLLPLIAALLFGQCLTSVRTTSVDEFKCYMFYAGMSKTWKFEAPPDLHIKQPKVAIDHVDINVIIPVMRRTFDFALLMDHWQIAVSQTNLSVQVVLVEAGRKRAIRDDMLAAYPQLMYVFFPNHWSNGMFPKALLYNIGFLKSRAAPWNIFHDYEIAVPHDFLVEVGHLISSRKDALLWAQPYSGRRVCYLNQTLSAQYRNLFRASNERSTSHSSLVKQHCPLTAPTRTSLVSPGGSLLVKTDAFIDVGGYDDDLFFGYSTEDQFLWDKLSVLQPPVYLEDKINLVHLYHTHQGYLTGLHFANMVDMLTLFRAQPDEVKAQILTARKARLVYPKTVDAVSDSSLGFLEQSCGVINLAARTEIMSSYL